MRKEPSGRLRWLGGWATLAALALVIAACSSPGSGSTTSTTAADTTTTTGDGAPSTTAVDDPLEDLVEAALAEGELTAYWGVDETTGARVKERFEAAYPGMTFNFERIPGNIDTANRFYAENEGGSSSAEILINTQALFLEDALGRGLLLPVSEWNVPSIENVPDVFRSEGYITAGLFRLDNIVVNTNNVPEAERPRTWADLMDPKWRGRMVSNDPREVFTTLSIYRLIADTVGMEWIDALGQAELQYVESLVTAAQIIAAGEKDIAIGIGQIHLNALLQDAPDAPIELIRMEGPAFGAAWNVGLASRGNVNAGRLFVNWLFSTEGQQAFNETIGPAVVPGVEIENFPPLGDDYVPLQVTEPSEQPEIISRMGLD